MPIFKLYPYKEVMFTINYDVVDLAGEDGINAKLTAYDLLAVMAAPCTRLDYDHTDRTKRTKLMEAVHSFVNYNPRLTNLNRQGLVKELNKSFLPRYDENQLREFMMGFRLVDGFDEDGFAIFNEKTFNAYKGNIDRGADIRIEYYAMSGASSGTALPDKAVTKTYHVQKVNGVYSMDLDFTVEDWVNILRGASEKGLKLIEAFYNMEGHRATHSQIEEASGIMSSSINGITMWLGERAKRIMGVEVIYCDGSSNCWMLPFNNGCYVSGGEFVWELRPEVASAYERLKKK